MINCADSRVTYCTARHFSTRSSRTAAKTRHGSESSEGVLQVVEPVATADDITTTTVAATDAKVVDSDDVDDDVAGGLEAESEDTITATTTGTIAAEDAPRQEGEVFIPLQDRDFT
jgi:hypothetical protein